MLKTETCYRIKCSLKNKFDSTKDNPHIATTETPAIAMLTSKFSTTNHIIELFVALVHKPKTTSSIIKINIVATGKHQLWTFLD